MNFLLTTAIPTFNRPNELRRAVSVLIPQLRANPDVKLVIRDNASEIPAQEVVGELLKPLSSQVEIVRNDYNIGGNANILRIFEKCNTQWLWVFGDDDIPRDNAIQTIKQHISDNLAFVFFDFPQMQLPIKWESDTITGNKIGDLFKLLKGSTTPLSLLSAAVYNTSRISRFLPRAYALSTSGIPHLIMAYLSIIQDETRWMLSRKCICDYTPPQSSAGAPMFNLMLQAPLSLLAFTSAKDELDEMIRSMRSVHAKSPEFALYSTITGCNFSKCWISTKCSYLFGLIRSAYHPGISHPFLELRWFMMAMCSIFPRIFYYTINIGLFLLGRRTPYEGDASRA